MRQATVPVDLVSEQKVILGLVSIRQLIYVAIAVSLSYNLISLLSPFLTGFNLVVKVITYTIFISPILAISGWLGFWFRDDHDMFWDKYLLISFLYLFKKEGYIYRHGSEVPEWRNVD